MRAWAAWILTKWLATFHEKELATGDILSVYNITLSGTICEAPYVLCRLREYGIVREFWARIDTGADITCIPELAISVMHKPVKKVLHRGHDGVAHRSQTYSATILLLGTRGHIAVSPARGVLLTKSPIGLIGMDVIRPHLDVSLVNGKAKVRVRAVRRQETQKPS